jgi:hypothetical protein
MKRLGKPPLPGLKNQEKQRVPLILGFFIFEKRAKTHQSEEDEPLKLLS